MTATTSRQIADLRKSYERAELSEDASHADGSTKRSAPRSPNPTR
jgi:hypothetical protein